MKTNIVIILATVYLGILSMLGYTGASTELCAYLYLVSPLIIVFLVYVVLTEDEYPYPELGKDEWGYRDKNKNELDIF
jgi:hypothetical protein